MAAGLGFKTFTTGEVLTAADTNGYLMQGVLVFADAAARDAAITSPQEGQFAYTKDVNGLWYYDSTAWVASGATGDIEGVTAGTGISGGGTSGTVTITNSMATAIDAKGDLIGGTGADAFDRLAVGADGTQLVADSTEATGLKWAAASSGALTLIKRASFSNVADTSTTFDNVFTSTYKVFQVQIETFYAATPANAPYMLLRRSGVTQTAGYTGGALNWLSNSATVGTNVNSNNTTQFSLHSASGSSTYPMCYNLTFYNIGNGAAYPNFTGAGVQNTSTGTGIVAGGFVDASNAYDGFLLKSSSSNVTGTVSVYGLATA